MGRAAKQKSLRRQTRKQLKLHTSTNAEVWQNQNGVREEGSVSCSVLSISDEQKSSSPPKQEDVVSPPSEITILSQEEIDDPIFLPLPPEEQAPSLDSYVFLEPSITSQEIIAPNDENVLDLTTKEVPKQWMSNASLDSIEGNFRLTLKRMPSHHPNRGNVLHQLCVLLQKRGFIPQALEVSEEVIQLLPKRSDYVKNHQLLQTSMQSYSGVVDPIAEIERVKSLETLADQEQQKRDDIHREEERKKVSRTMLPFSRKIATSSSVPWQQSSSFTTSMILTQHSGISKPLFNSTHEYRLYKVLLELFPLYLVYPNMALHGIFYFKVMKPLLDPEVFEYFLKAHVDVCLIRPSDYYPVVAIELDSTLHDEEDAVRKDGLKDRIFHLGGVDLLRLRPLESYSDEEMRREVIDLLEQWNQHFQQERDPKRNTMETKDESHHSVDR